MTTAALRKCLWSDKGARLLPKEAALIRAIEACADDELWRFCELGGPSPLYLLPTVEWIRLLHKQLTKLKAKRVLEIGAGDGFLSRSLAALKPSYALRATDSGAWVPPHSRMSRADMLEFKGVRVPGLHLGPNVEQMGSDAAIKKYKPDVVLVSWAPPGPMVDRAIRAGVPHVLDISVDGDVCGNGTKTWRFDKEFLDGPLEDRALCRLDAAPRKQRHTRVTLYFGAPKRLA